MRSLALVGLLALISVYGQGSETEVPYFPADLKQYLVLTEDQVKKITELNTQSNSFQIAKQTRQGTLQSEIYQETAKQSPDPLSIGIRFVEIETIRRELVDEKKRVVGRAQELLTVEQRTKLSVLQEALRLYPTACNAINQSLLDGQSSFSRSPFPSNVIPPSRYTKNEEVTLNSFFLLGTPCSIRTIPTLTLRSGDFSDSPSINHAVNSVRQLP